MFQVLCICRAFSPAGALGLVTFITVIEVRMDEITWDLRL